MEKQKYFLLTDAEIIADEITRLLSPYCSRIQKAGSIRRRHTLVSDIEIVCIPKKIKAPSGLFDETDITDPQFCSIVNKWQKIKGEPDGRYTQRIITNQSPLLKGVSRFTGTGDIINLDLFIADKNNFGLIYMIRTGSAAFARRMMTECKSWGYYVKDGYLHNSRSGEIVPLPEEEDFFRITKIDFVKPALRTM